MNNIDIIRYSEQSSANFLRWLYILFLGPFIVWCQYMVASDIPVKLAKHDISEVFFGVIFLLISVVGIYTWVVAIYELKIVATTVELTPERITGTSRYGKHWEMDYKNVVSITVPRLGGWHITLKDANGKQLNVSVSINLLGECMETLQKRAVNVKKVNFGIYRDNPHIWKK